MATLKNPEPTVDNIGELVQKRIFGQPDLNGSQVPEFVRSVFTRFGLKVTLITLVKSGIQDVTSYRLHTEEVVQNCRLVDGRY